MSITLSEFHPRRIAQDNKEEKQPTIEADIDAALRANKAREEKRKKERIEANKKLLKSLNIKH